jgi:hypothetical protein
MATDRSRDAYRGLVLLDPRFGFHSLNAAESTFTQAGPRPGVPVDQSDPRSKMVLKASGSQAADSQLRVQTIRAGMPGVAERGGGFAYKDETDASWFGWDVPNVVTGWEWLAFLDNAATLTQFKQPHAIRLQNGDVLCALRGDGSLAPERVVIKRFDVSGGTFAWSTVESINPSDDLGAQTWPCLLELPDGRVLVFFWIVDTGTSKAQIQTWQSTDRGDTWTLASRFALRTEVDNATWNLGRIRAGYGNGQILLVAQLTNPVPPSTEGEALIQWASDDQGASFTTIYTFDIAADENGAVPDILPLASGGFWIIYQDPVNGPRNAARRISTAWQSMGDVTIEPRDEVDQPNEDLAAWAGEDGAWYYAVRANAGTISNVTLVRSLDEGVTWTRMESGSGASVFEGIWIPGDTTTYLTDFCAVETCGRTVFITRVSTTASIDSYSVAALYLGGHSTVTMPSRTTFREDTAQQTWKFTWLAIEEPDDITATWTRTLAGGATVALEEDGLHLTTAAGADTAYYDTNGAGLGLPPDVTQELTAVFEVTGVSGGALTALRIGIVMRIADGVDDYGVRIAMTTTGYRVLDDADGSQVGSDQTLDLTQPAQIKVCIGAEIVRIWHRTATTPGHPEREWVAGPTGALDSNGAPAARANIRWGHIIAPVAATESYWRIVCLGYLDDDVVGLQNGQTNPDDLFARGYSASPIRLPGLVRIAAADGPTYVGDLWNIDTEYEYGVEQLDPRISPSPSRVYKATANTEQIFVFDISEESGANTRLETTTWAFGLFGASTYNVKVEGYDEDGAAWTELGSGTDSGALAFRRVGDTLIPDDTDTYNGGAHPYFHRNALRGAVAYFVNGTDYRRISRNTEGYWGEDDTTRKPVVFLDPDYLDGTEDTADNLFRIGPGERGQVIVVHDCAEYSKIRVTLNPTGVGAGWGTQVQAGTFFFGPVVFFGNEYSWGRVQEVAANVALSTRRGGGRFARRQGPPRRVVEFAWSEGADDRQLFAGEAPDYIRGTDAGEPVAVHQDIGSMLAGLLEQNDGALTPVIYLPRIEKGPPDEVHLLWPHEFVYGRITNAVRRETILGDEGEGEVVRVASIRIEEEV